MRRAVPAVVLLSCSLACGRSEAPPASAPSLSPSPSTTPSPSPSPSPSPPLVREIPISLSGAVGTNKCQVTEINPTPRRKASPDDVVRWSFAIKTGECKLKRLRIKPRGDVIDCNDSHVITPNVKLPIEDCDREVVSGEVTTVYRLACSVESGAGYACYKYTIAGLNIVNGDPEIEIEGPRFSPPPMSTPAPSASPSQGQSRP
jgi:hypothetical protein